METNEALQTALGQVAEAELLTLVKSLNELRAGDLKGLEERALATAFAIGRGLLACLLSHHPPSERPAARRVGSCGHRQRLVGQRSKQLLTAVGKISFPRPYYQCVQEAASQQAEGKEPREPACSHGEAPADALWGVQARRTSPKVQECVSYLAARLTLEEVAETFSRMLPLSMSARQVLTLMQPVGEALLAREDEHVSELWEQAAQVRTEQAMEAAAKQESIDRLSIELDGVTARLRRGSVPMEEKEQKRSGDVYREVKVGAVFGASRGPERSGLAPGVFVDEAGDKQYVARRAKAEDFGKLLYALAADQGLARAKQVVVLGDGARWIWRLAAEHFAGAVQIVDLWHAREHVWKVARATFEPGTSEAVAWAEQACSEARCRAKSRNW